MNEKRFFIKEGLIKGSWMGLDPSPTPPYLDPFLDKNKKSLMTLVVDWLNYGYIVAIPVQVHFQTHIL